MRLCINSLVRRGIFGLLGAIAWLAVAAPVGAAPERRSFDVGPQGQLVVRTELGTIQVSDGEPGKVVVEVERDTTDPEIASLVNRLKVDFTQQGKVLRVDARLKPKTPLSRGNDRMAVFRISVPRGFEADLETAGGNISVQDLAGSVRAKTSGGNLTLVNLAGPVTAVTEGGNARVEQALGGVAVRTSGGGITARLAQLPREDVELSATGGNITFSLAPRLAIDLDASANGGRVSAAPGLKKSLRSAPEGTSLLGKLNGGGPTVTLRTSGGNITIEEEPSEAAAGAPAAREIPVENLEGKDIGPVIDAFNADRQKLRLLILLSPGCHHCVEAARQVDQVLKDFPGDRVRPLVVWLPLLSKDDYALAREAAASLQDPRAVHYWEPQKILALEFGQQLPLPKEYEYKFAVDVFLIYPPGAVWPDNGVPVPGAWLHKLGEDERKFDPEKLRKELRAQLGGSASGPAAGH